MKRINQKPSAGSIQKRILISLLTVLFTLVFITQVEAQFQNQIEVHKPDLSTWPNLVTHFRVFDSQGAFLKGLTRDDVLIRENGQEIASETLEMLEPGVRLIVAVNEGPTLANRFAQVARIDKVKRTLLDWAESKPSITMDTLSLVTNSGSLAVDLKQVDQWVSLINDYQPNLKTMKPSLDSLSAAVEMAAEQNQDLDQNAAILYITPLPSEDQISGLRDILSRAELANVRLFIWLAGPDTYDTDPKASLLRSAAETTKGNFLIFTGAEELPKLSTYLDPLSYVYEVSYRSQIKQSGEYSFAVNIDNNGTQLESVPLSFSIIVQPPNPILLDPPSSIERTWTDTRRKRDSVLTPESVPIEIMVEFPDGMERQLVYSRLFIDNRLADENTIPPFENFEWDISEYSETGIHLMSVSIQDEVGIIKETAELAVEIVVLPKPLTWVEKLISRFSIQVIALFIVISLAGILLVLLAIRTMRVNRQVKLVRTRLLDDPVTQPLEIDNETIIPLTHKVSTEAWPHLAGIGQAPARLVLITTPTARETFPAEIAIGNRAITFGNDAKKVNVFLDSPLISPLHAKIEGEELKYKVFDTGSSSGTWLNYAPVSHYGALLDHGDVVQFGKIAYRFEIYGRQSKKIKVETLSGQE